MLKRALLLGVLALVAEGVIQAQPAADEVTADSRELVLEDENVSIYRMETLAAIPEQKFTSIRDSVIVRIGSEVFKASGDVMFVRGRTGKQFADSVQIAGRYVIVELKKHWDAEIRVCNEPKRCTRDIMVSGSKIGETNNILTNGFVTVQRHQLIPGGTLSSSYFSAQGQDHIVLLPLSDLHASFGGPEQNLRQGQPYVSEATEVEVMAADHDVQWLVIRIHTPQKAS